MLSPAGNQHTALFCLLHHAISSRKFNTQLSSICCIMLTLAGSSTQCSLYSVVLCCFQQEVQHNAAEITFKITMMQSTITFLLPTLVSCSLSWLSVHYSVCLFTTLTVCSLYRLSVHVESSTLSPNPAVIH